jgi:hypothetical protein
MGAFVVIATNVEALSCTAMASAVEPLLAARARAAHSLLLAGSSLYVLHANPNGALCIDVDSLRGREVPGTEDDSFRAALDGADLLLCQPWNERVVRHSIESGRREVLVTGARGVASVARWGRWLAWHYGAGAAHTICARLDGAAPMIVSERTGSVIAMDADERGVAIAANASEGRDGGVFFARWGERAEPVATGYHHCKRVQILGDELWFAGVTAGVAESKRDGLWRAPLSGGPPEQVVETFDVRGFYRGRDGALAWASFDGRIYGKTVGQQPRLLATLSDKIADAVADEEFIYAATYKPVRGTATRSQSVVVRVRWR